MNSGISPSLLQPNQYAFGVNVTNRGGFVRTRPLFRQIAIDFGGNSDAESWFQSKPISGQDYFQPATSVAQGVCCAGGRFFSFMMGDTTATAFEFTPSGSRNDQYQDQTWFCQAANLLVAQNGEDIPVIYDGANGRRSQISALNECPVGRQMAYINDRLFVVLPDMREIAPGDLAYETATSVVTFTEINEEPGGGPLSIPLEIGGITGMVVTAQVNTIAGQGQLLVTTDRAISSINPVVNRASWDTIQLQSIALVGNGYSGNGLAVVNADVWGRSVDGIRSYIMAERNFLTFYGPSWGNTPQSREVARILEDDDASLLRFSSMVYFDNRLICTVAPTALANGAGCYHQGMAVLNFDNISSITTKSTPTWESVWTGINPYGFFTGSFNDQQRCFAFCYNPQTQLNELWEITTEYGDDSDVTPIAASIESKSFNFQAPYAPKSLQGVEVFVYNLVGNVDFTLEYKPDQYPCWLPYRSWSECAGSASCSPQGNVDGGNITDTYRGTGNIDGGSI